MPRYDYKCKKCSYKKEVEHTMDYTKIVKCPKCKSKMEKQIGLSTIIVRGQNPASTARRG